MGNDTKKITIEEFEEQLKSGEMEECEYGEFGECQFIEPFYQIEVNEVWGEEVEQDEFETARVRGDEYLARQAHAWLQQTHEEDARWYGMIVGVDVVLAEGRVGPWDDIDFVAGEAVKNNPGKPVSVLECNIGEGFMKEDGDYECGMRYDYAEWRVAKGYISYDLTDAKLIKKRFLGDDPSHQQTQSLYCGLPPFCELALVCEGGAATPWGITDKDGCRKPATLLIPLKKEEAELWKKHELDDDALMKIALSAEFSIE